MLPRERNPELEAIELRLLLEGIFQHYGHDFRQYAQASVMRRVRSLLELEKLDSISALQGRILHDAGALERFLFALSVHMTAMFRDPGFYRAIRDQVVPILQTYPFVRIWHAGCATGEEVYSLAILLHEEGLLERCRIYATDMNETVLGRARSGIFPLAAMKEYTSNYIAAGGRQDFSRYYTAGSDNAILRGFLRKQIVFAPHNLATDGPFNEFHLICCRNVLIYFNKDLQDRVHKLLFDSLAPLGLLGLGSKETLRFSAYEHFFKDFDIAHRLYRRML
jgi:chemotaxis protein methyltransferase CheR